MADEGKKITFAELVEARKEDMKSIRPGFMTVVTDGKHSIEISSPSIAERTDSRLRS